MEAFRTLRSVVTPLEAANVDTDQIIPAVFLKRVERTGFEDFLFYEWRKNPQFVLNDPAYQGSKILVAGKNFGCGSSREHAAWALAQYGFRCVLAPSFADIFHSNAGKNGILLVTLPEEEIGRVMLQARARDGYSLNVSLEENQINDQIGLRVPFRIDPFRREFFLGGLDEIGLTLRHAVELAAYEGRHDEAVCMRARA